MEHPAIPDEKAMAITAAESATHVAADLLRFAREGEQPDGLAFDLDTIELGARLLSNLVAIELPRLREKDSDDDGARLLVLLARDLLNFLDGWA